MASSPDNDGTGRYCQTARVRQARREGVRVQKPVVEPPQGQNRLQSGGCGPVAAHAWAKSARVTPKPVNRAGGEAMRKACGVLMAMLSGKSWAPHPSNGQQ